VLLLWFKIYVSLMTLDHHSSITLTIRNNRAMNEYLELGGL